MSKGWQVIFDCRVIVALVMSLLLVFYYSFQLKGVINLDSRLNKQKHQLLQKYVNQYRSAHHFNLLVHQVSDIDYLMAVLSGFQGAWDKSSVLDNVVLQAKRFNLVIKSVKWGRENKFSTHNEINLHVDLLGSFFKYSSIYLSNGEKSFFIAI